MGNFNGIVEYHDGLAVSDYVNMLPLGETCVDRIGDALIDSGIVLEAGSEVRGTFIDSTNKIYIVYGNAIYMAQYTPETDTIGPLTPMQWYLNGEKTNFNTWKQTGRVTFCESSIKPSIVFCCDGKYIYMWNTTVNNTTRPERDPFIVNMMYLPEMVIGDDSNGGSISSGDTLDGEFNLQDSIAGISGSANISGWEEKNDYIASICWFDNKLVGCNKAKNTVWITRTDPGWYFRETGKHPLNPDDGIDLWYNWYSSTNNADNLIDVASYAGQLYFFNDHSIEVWGRTGNEDSPIQPNTTQVIHFGGRNPLIFEGVLYFIASDAMNDEFIAAFSPQFQKLSNKEIERRLGRPLDLQIITQRHENYLFVRNEDCSGFLFRDGRWSSWDNPSNATYRIRNSIVRDYAITDTGRITKFDEELRTTGGVRYNRYIRDGFVQFPKRVIFRRFYLIMDTGKTDRDVHLYRPTPNAQPVPDPVLQNLEMYAAISTNRGMSFSQRRYRKLGLAGHNNKVIEWRNLGSGNSFLIEFGTSSLHKLQIYAMGVDTQ